MSCGVECACACVLRVVENFVVAYLELSRDLQPIRSFKSNLIVVTDDSTKTVRTHVTRLFSVLGQAITVEIIHNVRA